MTSQLFPSDPTNPSLDAAQVRAVLAQAWSVEGELSDLGSMQDQNFRVRRPDGSKAVAKIASIHTGLEGIELQDAAMRHVAAHVAAAEGAGGRGGGFASPKPIDTVDGHDIVEAGGHHLRLLSWVEGTPLSERGYLGLADLAELGALAARVSQALEGFEHSALRTTNQWDIRLSALVLAESRATLPASWHVEVDDAISAFASVGSNALLPMAVVHGDMTPVNAVCLAGHDLAARPVGVLDFGDVMRTWRIGDVAASAVGAVEHPGTGDALDAVLAVLRGYHATIALTEEEITAFWPLVMARAAVTAAISYRQLARNAHNDYAEQSVESGLRAMRRLAAIPPALARAAARSSVGLDPVPTWPAISCWLTAQPVADVVDGLSSLEIGLADLSVDNPAFSCAEWTDAGALRGLFDAAPLVLARWGEARLTENPLPQREAPPSVHLGVDLMLKVATQVRAPLAGVVYAIEHDAVTMDVGAEGGLLLVRLSGITPRADLATGTSLSAGLPVGAVAAGELAADDGLLPPHLHLQFMLADALPAFGGAYHRLAWQALCPDPSLLLPVGAAVATTVDAPTRRLERESVVARPQHLYFDRPLEIVRGWRHFLYDSDGRCYLDMINNIASVGHSHPRVTDAALHQLRRLNTNSRFLYDSMTRYSQRIAELLPAELDRVFLVNSGSEAADLALQLARRFTGRTDVIALAGAYHGWTGSVLDVSTSPGDRPNWRAELPGYVHVAVQPDTYRGEFGDDVRAYRESVRAACVAGEARGGVAAFISEPLLGNQGAVELPEGYLQGVYEDVRRAGGLCVADEVQVGLGRTGETFWAFQHEGVVPDIVFTAKATGNGHPLGVVVCRQEIADAFDGNSAYFSSTGGGPVSCEIGLSVLDVIRDEGLQNNARVVGGYLKQQLIALASKHEMIGAVHGRGLYLGIDLVSDRASRAPSIAEALAVSERLRSLGVIMQPTGDAFNVLKVKPPLCLDAASADYFVSALDHTLTEFT